MPRLPRILNADVAEFPAGARVKAENPFSCPIGLGSILRDARLS